MLGNEKLNWGFKNNSFDVSNEEQPECENTVRLQKKGFKTEHQKKVARLQKKVGQGLKEKVGQGVKKK